MRVAVLLGGDSSEREVSLKSGKCIADALESMGHEVVSIDPRHIDITLQGFFKLDKVFIALHGGIGEGGHLQALLDLLKIPYTGSGMLASALSLNKMKTKEIWRYSNLKTADWLTVNKNMPEGKLEAILSQVICPVVVKPLTQGCSIGISKVETKDQLFDAVINAFEYDDTVLVESFITGREYTCAVLGDKALPVVQIKSDVFFDFDAKFGSQSATYHCPCDLSIEQQSRMQSIILQAYKALGCRGWGRIDVILDENDEVNLIEMNTVPGMTMRSVFPMAAEEFGLNFNDVVGEILDSACFDEVI
jgi:D-alanine-D-alanine ligase